jgi:hypothetical protein
MSLYSYQEDSCRTVCSPKSWFDAGDVPPDFERRATWRYGVGLGLRYRL